MSDDGYNEIKRLVRTLFDAKDKINTRQFDAVFYKKANPDVDFSNVNPISHYILDGYHEGRLPRARIKLSKYLVEYVRANGGFIKVARRATKGGIGFASVRAKINRALKGFYERDFQRKARDRNNYALWVKLYDTVTDEVRRKALKELRAGCPLLPKISIVMPTYNTPESYLSSAIESVINQVYPNWELCICDDASSLDETKSVLEHYKRLDSRIKIRYREVNGHISAASNGALKLADGDYIALLDHDDELHAMALYHVAIAILNNASPAIIYSDEDKLNHDGSRVNPYFKPDWNYGLFLSQNMISHLGVYRSDLVRKVGGFRLGFEGSQDYDLALRVLDAMGPDERIVHIPRVLYHWRMHAESTSMALDNKSYAITAGEAALNQHLKRKNEPLFAAHIGYGYRVSGVIPTPYPLISIIVYGMSDGGALDSIKHHIKSKTSYKSIEILEVSQWDGDAGLENSGSEVSLNGSVALFRAFNDVIKSAKGDFICIYYAGLSPSCEEWLDELVLWAMNDDVGLVAPLIIKKSGKIHSCGVITSPTGGYAFPHRDLHRFNHGYFGRASLMQAFSALGGGCLLFSRTVYEKIGPLPEVNNTFCECEVAYSLRASGAGLSNMLIPAASLELDDSKKQHRLMNLSTDFQGVETIYLAKEDPSYNINLSISPIDFSLAWPPRTEELMQALKH